MTMNLARFLLPMLLVPTVAGVDAVAQAAEPPPTVVVTGFEASDRADELVKRGIALAKTDHFVEAEPLMREAWSLKRSYDIAANLGIVEAALNQWRAATEHLTYALKTFPANGKPEHKKLLEQSLAKAVPQVATLTVKVGVEKAEVFIDGKSVGLTPLADVMFVEPGKRTIEARLLGYETATQTVDASKGRASEIALTLRKLEPVPPPTATVAPPVPTLPPLGGGPKTGVLVAGGVTAGVALVAGVVFTAVANGKASAATKSHDDLVNARGPAACPDQMASGCQDLHDLIGTKNTFSRLAAWSFVGAGAIGAATLIYGLAAPKATTKSGLQLVPVIMAREGGIVVRGAW